MQNFFQLAFFTCTSIRFDIRSCFHQETENIIIRVAMVVSVHILCGYVTLPLYALMGTSMRKSVFTENVIRGIQIWQDKAKKKYTSSALNEIVVADQKISPSQKCSIFSKYPDMLANLGHACCFLSMEHSI
ncbi:MLO-like protein 12 [Glycine soja]|uniref:MLO-like protein 12 n=1 Tax=Glycine soja TaxID=3848 RepID=A0A445GQW4_GLYSO|nr:MLO-like protein 12 [Glycine soja]